jgi:acetolactate synthase-1/2/3 large subunit
MNRNELCTAVPYNIPVVTVLLNNQVLGMVRQWQTFFYDKHYSNTTLERKTNYVKLAEAFGAVGWRCTNPAEFKEALQKALAHNGPSVIECVIDRDEKVLPMIQGGKDIMSVITN